MLSLKEVSQRSTLAVTMAALVSFASSIHAADYETRVVATGLKRPTGIVVAGNRTLYISQLPTPGVPGPAGGSNTVDRIKLGSGKLENLTTGEPEPTNLALSKKGELYWTCKSAGVILERNRKGDVTPFLRGLTQPSGISPTWRIGEVEGGICWGFRG